MDNDKELQQLQKELRQLRDLQETTFSVATGLQDQIERAIGELTLRRGYNSARRLQDIRNILEEHLSCKKPTRAMLLFATERILEIVEPATTGTEDSIRSSSTGSASSRKRKDSTSKPEWR